MKYVKPGTFVLYFLKILHIIAYKALFPSKGKGHDDDDYYCVQLLFLLFKFTLNGKSTVTVGKHLSLFIVFLFCFCQVSTVAASNVLGF